MQDPGHRIERAVIKLILWIVCGLIGIIALSIGGYRFYASWQERHLVRRAAAYLGGGDLKDAALCARRALQLKEHSAGAARIIAEVLERSGKRAAVDWRRQVVEWAPASTEDLVAWARTALQFEDLGAAEQAVARLEDGGKRSAAFYAVSAEIARARRQDAEAERNWAEAVRLAPADKSFQLQLAISQLESEDVQKRKAARASLEGLRDDPAQRAAATRVLINDAMKRSELRRARELALELQNAPGAKFEDRLRLLDVLHQMQDPAFTSGLTEAEERAAHDVPSLALLIAWMNLRGMTLLALDFVKTLPPEMLDTWPLPLALADSCSRVGDWATLERHTQKTNWTEGDYLRRAYLARALRGQDKQVAADREWAGVEKDAASGPERLLRLIELTSEWGWNDQTVKLLGLLQKHPEKHVEALHTLYSFYAKARDTQGMYRALLSLCSAEPNNLETQNNFAQVSLLLNAEPDRARKIAAEVYHKQPAKPSFASTYAYALYSKGDFAQAVQTMETLSEQELRDPAISAYYGIFLVAAGQVDKARPFLAAADVEKLLPEEKFLVEQARRRAQSVSPPS